jgi:hypothetical protein
MTLRSHLLFLLLLASCIDDTKTGMHKNSQSIKESKENGVFRQVLNTNKSIIKVGDNKTDSIEQIWLEDAWTYETEKGSIVVKKDNFQQCLILFTNLSKKADSIWLKQRNSYVEWNGVLSAPFDKATDTFLVVKKILNQDTVLDTLIVSK